MAKSTLTLALSATWGAVLVTALIKTFPLGIVLCAATVAMFYRGARR